VTAPARQALSGATAQLAAGGCDTPRLDAELLLAHVLGVSRERLYAGDDLGLDGAAQRALHESVRRRASAREPVAYITGRRAFRHLNLAVDRRALIPRPETELLVEAALALPAGARVLDVGTGCGAVALALAQERPDLSVTASDISREALALARENARRLGLEVRFVQSDLLGGLRDEFDALVANLPYVAETQRATLAPEITRHEPPAALFGGEDGLAKIAALAAQLPRFARLALVGLEVGAGQAETVAELVRGAGFARARIEADLAGINRVVIGEGPRA
jgi:release factor glutamine methyltransferase